MIAQVDMSICIRVEIFRVPSIAGTSYMLNKSTQLTLPKYELATGGPRLIVTWGIA
jgi:hypothetical protein